MKLMKVSVIGMVILTFLLVICAGYVWVDSEAKFYTSPLFLVTVIVLLIFLIMSLFSVGLTWRRIGFYISHMGIVVVIIGAFVSFYYKEVTHFNIPIDETKAYSNVMDAEGNEINFGFQVSVTDFTVGKYDPDYQLHIKDSKSETGLRLIKDKIRLDRKGQYYLGKELGHVDKHDLMNEEGYVKMIEIEENYFLMKLPQGDKSYQVHMKIYDESKVARTSMEMNHPFTYKGWKFYIMDYDHEYRNYVTLLAKHDKATLPIGIGIWMIMIGTVIMCFQIVKRRGRA